MSLLQTIQHGLPVARGRGALSISCVLGQQVVFDTQLTPVVTQFTLIINANNFVLVERTIWQGFEAELAFKRPVPLSISAQGGLFLLPTTVLLLHHLQISQTTAHVDGHNVCKSIAFQKK